MIREYNGGVFGANGIDEPAEYTRGYTKDISEIQGSNDIGGGFSRRSHVGATRGSMMARRGGKMSR